MSRFKKSSYSSVVENCVEISVSPDLISIRDSKNHNGPILQVTPTAYHSFAQALREGRLVARLGLL
ncbi:DUF397 domain-containing protein [Streptomyces olivoreticuli]